MKTGLILMLMTFGLSSFAQDSNEEQVYESRAIEALYSAVSSLVDADLRCSADFDCEILARGAKACGGPQSFAVVSRNNSLYSKIIYLNLEQTQKEEAYNFKYGVISTCDIPSVPKATCIENVCVKNYFN